jgi:hypothetical protein
MLREGVADRIEFLWAVIDDPDQPMRERLTAWGLAAKYSLPVRTEAEVTTSPIVAVERYELPKTSLEPGAETAAIQQFRERFGQYLPPAVLAMLPGAPGSDERPGPSPAGFPGREDSGDVPSPLPPPVPAPEWRPPTNGGGYRSQRFGL